MNKHIAIIVTALPLMLGILLNGCKKDDYKLNTNLQPVGRLTAPVDNKFVKLQPTTSATVSFEWDQARAEDGSLVLYEVAFDKEDGDFSNPVAKYTSDGGGVQNTLTLSHKELNSIAGAAGIPALGVGKLKWTVLAAKGYNVQPAAETRLLEVERPNGFAEIPVDVYLTGEATEGGADLANALRLKSIGNGVFEIYTSLKDGAYRFVDRTTGTPTTYSVDGAILKEGGESTHTGTKVYRLRLDFNNTSATVTEITGMGLWFAPDDKFLFDLSYAGNGTFVASNQTITFRQESWGRDERYKFRLNVKAADGTDGEEWWGSSNADNSRPTSATPLSFWELRPIANNDRWNYCYKFMTEVDTKACDVKVYFQADKNYTHEVIVL
ncbi:SusE domain-containing protein [Chitinophaga japonensis]|uniref:SusE-like outer membrane protein n=1 Tax=Chitinophaga japonensis TaxID=104662 RepID=A0A562T7E1_CHIJA|nr:SusE domain-containing protein [Chitinophaga japonensis]TWI89158.1 SusE-like outer membrane protein [Chitinophaga japonensis]